ncbi:MAG: BrnA antitoxin family protein [Chloroflexi bacterium]|nr:BrnA antitoxin family protein [Chloroflexota bacterium]
MKDEYDFSKGERGRIIPTKGKTRITIYIDDSTLVAFRSRAEQSGTGYQTMMNDALKDYLTKNGEQPITESALRRILKEELPKMAAMT